ncbi:MAG TPA: tannase/feruloyl esterase family alpha/beta hydrolase [Bryobacteraceae bacterium]|jgi:feruloyl esterase|nr:tannase/feruloyl esterase family alpha/beta hydrolase [Bryobacteraceae bacterium]
MRTQSYFVATLLLVIASADAHAETGKCEQLSGLKLPNTTITTAESVPAGTFAPPYGDPLDKLPAFCRVAGVLKPSSDSFIRFEVWLPAADWNQRYLGVGNGGFAGSIDYRTLGGNLSRGYATAATDTGHEGEAGDASWAFHHPEKVVDFGHRGIHLTTETAKKLMAAFYDRPAQHAYFDSCSDGGREALMEAQRFPEDFDGILAGAPANAWTSLLASGIEVAQQMYRNPAAYISSVKIPAIGAAVLQACDAQDGVTDGIVGDPERCHFDPAALLCKNAEARDCLTAPQVASLKKLYAGDRNAQGRPLFRGYLPGGENGAQGWTPWIIGPAPGFSYGVDFVENYFRYIVFDDPAWNVLTANEDAAKRLADQKTAEALNATNPDLRRFQARGGKLIVYHGWNDPAISPLYAVSYFQQVTTTMGDRNAESFLRLYMVPGMQHCIGGPGPSYFGQLGTTTAKGPKHGIYTALEGWVEKGAAPGEIVATKYVGNDSRNAAAMTRPLCPYPQIAIYKGTGDTNDYTNFVCKNPE